MIGKWPLLLDTIGGKRAVMMTLESRRWGGGSKHF